MKFENKLINHQPKSNYLGKSTKPITSSQVVYKNNNIYGDFQLQNKKIILTIEEL